MGMDKRPLSDQVDTVPQISPYADHEKKEKLKPSSPAPEERMSRDRLITIGGLVHDFAQVFGVLHQIDPSQSDEALIERATTIIVKARQKLNEKLS